MWISVNEKMPELCGYYDVVRQSESFGQVRVPDVYCDGDWWEDISQEVPIKNVSHWMFQPVMPGIPADPRTESKREGVEL